MSDKLDDLASYVGEGIHTSLRKYADSDAAHRAWTAIRDMPNDEWSGIVRAVATEILKANFMQPKIELMIVRDPDASDQVTVFVDGVQFDGYAEEQVDPGAGYSRSDWDEHTETVTTDESYSTAFRAAVAQARDEYADNQYIDQDEDEDEDPDGDAAKDGPMIRFQQEPNEELQSPWPVIILSDGSVLYGRPDAHFLSGFGPQGTNDITVFWKQALKDPEKAVGLIPVFVGPGGAMFAIDLKVKDCSRYEADRDAIDQLAEREAQMRDVFLNLDNL